jgi:hypothetical protein
MRRGTFRWPALLLLSAIGCDDSGRYTYTGYYIEEYMPLDGERFWTYSQEADDISWILWVEKLDKTRTVGDARVSTLEYSEFGKPVLYTVDWSSDSVNGVLIHGWADPQAKTSTTFAEPIQFGIHGMTAGDVIETTTDDITFTSTFVGKEDCPNDWVDQVWECARMELTGADLPFVGTYLLSRTYGASRFRTFGYDDDWKLLCFSDADGCRSKPTE